MAFSGAALPSAAQQPDPTAPPPTAPDAPTSTSTPEGTTSTTVAPPPTTSAPPTSEATTPSTPTTGAAPSTSTPGGGTVPGGTVPGGAGTTTVPGAPGEGASPAVAADALAGDTITLVPATDLLDGTAVTVTATGLVPGTWVQVVQCVTGAVMAYDGCDAVDSTYRDVDASGAATVVVRVDALLSVDTGGTTDCRVADACVLVVADEDATILARTALPFVPDGPLAPPPVATATPSEMLVHNQAVDVTASGLVWSGSATVLQCAADPRDRYADCDAGTARWAGVEPDGTLTTPFVVSALLGTSAGTVDCRTPAACTIVVAQDHLFTPARRATVPLAFDPDGEVVLPTLTVQPATDLVDGQTVTATGSGFAPGWVALYACGGATPSYDDCAWLDAYADIDAAGGFALDVAVPAIIPTATGEVDCRTSEHPCVLVASADDLSPVRSGRAELHFAPDGPVAPGPTLAVSPATDLPDEATITVTGANFASPHDEPARLEVCRTGDPTSCDVQAEAEVTPDDDGTFTVELSVAATFDTWGDRTVDCRVAPGCEVVGRVGYQGRRATAALTFGPPGTGGERYLDTVFDEVEVSTGVVYRHTTDAGGGAVSLALDVYEPAGDTEQQRPVVVWLPGSWFSTGGRAEMAAYAEAFARRGYVAVTMDYRHRPGLRCCPTDDVEGVTAAIGDATDDAAAGVAWLRDHADEYGIDPDAIAVGGHQGGAAAAFGLAHPLGEGRRAGDSSIAAALPIAGVGLGRPAAGSPPFLAFHAIGDNTAPLHLSTSSCARARAGGTPCDAVGYGTSWTGGLASSRQRDIVRRSSDFLAEVVLDPLGYLEWTGPTTPSGPDGPGTGGPGGHGPGGHGTGGGGATIVPTPAVLGPGVGVVAAASQAAGTLPRTGAGLARLVAVALALGAIGSAALLARRRHLQVGADTGNVRLAVGASLAVVAMAVAAFVAAGAMTSPPSAEEAEDAADHHDHDAGGHEDAGHADDHDDHPAGADGHPLGTHGVVDHAPGADHAEHDGDPGQGDHDDGGHHDDGDHSDGDHVAGTPTGAGHAHPTGPSAPDHPHAPDPTHPHPTAPSQPHPHPTTPTEPHPHPTVPTEPTDPDPGFDPDWTPEQVTYAQTLIDETEAQLERYANQAVLPLIGYQWISDGKGVDEYQHWIHLGRIVDARRIDPAYPESLVFRNAADGPVLEAAMYMLNLNFHLGNIPADIAWLPGWHIHDNLCFGPNYELYGVTVDGRCERGSVLPTPPMIHVWRVDTPCGRFAGVDEFGLQCDHDHEH